MTEVILSVSIEQGGQDRLRLRVMIDSLVNQVATSAVP